MRTTILFVLALSACKHTDKPKPAPQAPPAAPMAAPASTGAPGSQDLAPLAQLSSVLSREASARPHVKVTADQVFASLAAHGIALASEKQVLATTAQAAYCALGVTSESVAIAVCEYPTAEAARAGKRLLDTHYAQLVPDAVRMLNGSTLLTVANGSTHVALRDQVLRTFQSL